MTVCEGEGDIARDAISSLLGDAPPASIDAFVIDDASKSRVGKALVDHCASLGVTAELKVLPDPLGFRGCVSRLITGLAWIAEPGRPPYDFVVKLDPDALFLRPDFLRFIARHCSPRGIWGMVGPMRKRDRVLLLADLFPAGFRRKTTGTLIQRAWEPRRFRPVWWADIGRRALLNGFRFRYANGSMYALGGDTLRALAGRGYLQRRVAGRHGFITSEEDLMATLLTFAAGHGLTDLNQISPAWGEPHAGPHTDPQRLLAAGTYLLHPLKANPAGSELRRRFMHALEHARQAQSRSPLSAPTPG